MTIQNQTLISSDNAPGHEDFRETITVNRFKRSLAIFFKRMAGSFWSNTEKMGKSNTSSFNGLL